MSWSVEDHIPDLSGKTILITGCTSGLGYECAKQLLRRNAKLVMACRNPTKMQAVEAEFHEKLETPLSHIYKVEVDVSDLTSVRKVPAALQALGVTELHAIVLNAGIAGSTFARSKQGFELTFATNVLGHWLLTKLLLPLIAHVPSSRIVAVSSVTHFLKSGINYSVIRFEDAAVASFQGAQAYMGSKLALHWLVAQLNNYFRSHGGRTVAVAAHPGFATSEMTDPLSEKNVDRLYSGVIRFFTARLLNCVQQSTEQGAWPLTLAVGRAVVTEGEYYGPAGFLGLWGAPIANSRASAAVQDTDKQVEFWHVCEDLTGEKYPS